MPYCPSTRSLCRSRIACEDHPCGGRGQLLITGCRSATGTVAADAKQPDPLEQACCCSAPVKAREASEEPRTSFGWRAQAGQWLSQGWELCWLTSEHEPVDGGLVLSAGLEIGVGCEHDDLRLRSQLFESRRRAAACPLKQIRSIRVDPPLSRWRNGQRNKSSHRWPSPRRRIAI